MGGRKEFWSLDDETTIDTKNKWVNSKGYGGVFAWCFDGDNENADLLQKMVAVND